MIGCRRRFRGTMRLAGVRCAAMLLAGLVLVCPWQIASVRADEVPRPATDTSVRGRWLSAWNSLRGDGYALDGLERWLEPGQRLVCDHKSMVSYRGTTLRYAGSLLIAPAFAERLQRFERVVADAAREVYGREPRLIRHYGAFSCRSTRSRKHRISEHALGNALDLVGFDFGPASKAQPLPDGVPKQLRGAFQVRIARHFREPRAGDAAAALHAQFLTTLTARLRERDDIFRCMFGPGHGGHDDHLHLDAAPFRYIDL